MANKIIISCAITGSIHTPTMSEALPITPDQIATQAIDASKAGAAILHLATGDDVAGKSGLFFNGMNEAKADPQAYDAAARKRLRALSLELTGLSA